MNFIDSAVIEVSSGKGGRGHVSFRKEKYVPLGGPDGGNGGKGGDVVIEADRQLTTLLDFRYQRSYDAEDGKAGGSSRSTGKSGKDKIVPNEGIVFIYKGNTYKLTGTFAPLNQILGIFYE